MNPGTENKRTASQRIEDLERAMMSLFNTADNIIRDMMTIKEAIKLLGNKVDSIVKVSNSGQALTDENISAVMVQNNVDELKRLVDGYVANKLMAASTEISDSSFIVGCEVGDEGKVVNPRLQFALSSIAPELREKFNGAKVGDVLNLRDGALKFEIQEIYKIQDPTQEAAAETTEAPSEPVTQ